MRKLFLMSFGIVALSALISYPQSNAFAAEGDPLRDPDIKVYQPHAGDPCGEEENNFKAGVTINLEASHLVPTTPLVPVFVDIWVFEDRTWALGDNLNDPAILNMAVDTKWNVLTTDQGRIDCTELWTAPLLDIGAADRFYDIVIDADQDGFISVGDYYDGGKVEEGATYDFRVGPPKPPKLP